MTAYMFDVVLFGQHTLAEIEGDSCEEALHALKQTQSAKLSTAITPLGEASDFYERHGSKRQRAAINRASESRPSLMQRVKSWLHTLNGHDTPVSC